MGVSRAIIPGAGYDFTRSVSFRYCLGATSGRANQPDRGLVFGGPTAAGLGERQAREPMGARIRRASPLTGTATGARLGNRLSLWRVPETRTMNVSQPDPFLGTGPIRSQDARSRRPAAQARAGPVPAVSVARIDREVVFGPEQSLSPLVPHAVARYRSHVPAPRRCL